MRKIFSDQGERLFKSYVVKVYSPGNGKFERVRFAAPAGRGFGEKAIEEKLASIAEDIECNWPESEYKLVELGPTSFNFVWAGEKPIAQEQSA